MRRYEITGLDLSEVIKYLKEWLLAYKFSMENSGWFAKRNSLKAKTILGAIRARAYEHSGTLEVLFQFEASKVPKAGFFCYVI
jgi:hypothetical protein